MKKQAPVGEYNKLCIEAARTGWIVKQEGEVAKIFFDWERVIRLLEVKLTTQINEP